MLVIHQVPQCLGQHFFVTQLFDTKASEICHQTLFLFWTGLTVSTGKNLFSPSTDWAVTLVAAKHYPVFLPWGLEAMKLMIMHPWLAGFVPELRG